MSKYIVGNTKQVGQFEQHLEASECLPSRKALDSWALLLLSLLGPHLQRILQLEGQAGWGQEPHLFKLALDHVPSGLLSFINLKMLKCADLKKICSADSAPISSDCTTHCHWSDWFGFKRESVISMLCTNKVPIPLSPLRPAPSLHLPEKIHYILPFQFSGIP